MARIFSDGSAILKIESNEPLRQGKYGSPCHGDVFPLGTGNIQSLTSVQAEQICEYSVEDDLPIESEAQFLSDLFRRKVIGCDCCGNLRKI